MINSKKRGEIKEFRFFLRKHPPKKLVEFLLSDDGNLEKRVVRGGVWVFSLRVFLRGFEFIKTVLLARLLAPKDFGLMGIALLAMSILESFSQTGMQQALIQKRGNTQKYLNSAWTIQVARGIIIALILFFGAPFVGTFFNESGSTTLVRALALSELLKGFTHIGVFYFQKNLIFKKQFFYQVSGTLADLLISVPVAIIYKNSWALIIGLITGNLVRLLVSYKINTTRLKFKINKNQVRDLWGFGRWIFGSSVLIFLINQGDDIFVGKTLGTTILGLYQMAYKISNLPATEIAHTVSLATFPAYSKLQDSIPKLKKAYLKTLGFTTILASLITGLIFSLAPIFVPTFLGENWITIIPVIQVLVLAGLLRSIVTISGYIFYAIGKPMVDTKWQIVRLCLLAVFIYPFTNKMGIVGASLAVFISIFISSFGFIFSVIKITKSKGRDVFQAMFPSFVSGLTMCLFIFFLKKFFNSTNILNLFIIGVLGVSIYFFLLSFLDKRLWNKL